MSDASSDLSVRLREQVLSVTRLPRDFARGAHLYHELGVSSVEALQILVTLEEAHGLRIPDEDFVDATTLDALERLVRRLSAQDVP